MICYIMGQTGVIPNVNGTNQCFVYIGSLLRCQKILSFRVCTLASGLSKSQVNRNTVIHNTQQSGISTSEIITSNRHTTKILHHRDDPPIKKSVNTHCLPLSTSPYQRETENLRIDFHKERHRGLFSDLQIFDLLQSDYLLI